MFDMWIENKENRKMSRQYLIKLLADIAGISENRITLSTFFLKEDFSPRCDVFIDGSKVRSSISTEDIDDFRAYFGDKNNFDISSCNDDKTLKFVKDAQLRYYATLGRFVCEFREMGLPTRNEE